MTTLWKATLETARNLGQLRLGKITGSAAVTTLADSNMKLSAGAPINGTLWFLTGNLAHVSTYITGWDAGTYKFTFPEQAKAPSVGDHYAYCPPAYTQQDLISVVNKTLSELGPFLQRNEELVVVEDQVEYDLPDGVSNIKRVQAAYNAIAPYEWGPAHHWWMEWDGKLVFAEGYPPSAEADAGNKIRLWYEGEHPAVLTDADTITNAIHIERLAWTAAWFAAMFRANKSENSEDATEKLAQIANQMRLMEARHPIQTIAKDARWSTWF